MQVTLFISLLANYFGLHHKLQSVFVIDCRSVSDNVRIMTEASTHNLRLAFFDLNRMKNDAYIDQLIHTLLTTTHPNSYAGVFFNFNCPLSKAFISACSSKRCFAEHYKWFIHEQNVESEAIQQLQSTALYVDAEIAYINFADDAIESVNERLKKYAIYDVYNNAYTHGGRLNVNFDCYFVYDIEHKGGHLTASKLRQRSKYMNRSNTSDITLRAGLVLLGAKARNDTDAVLAYLLTDNETTVDTQSRHAANVISIIVEMLNCSVSYVHYDRWTGTDSYGEALQGIYENDIDVAYGLYLLTLNRFPYISIISQVSEYRSFFFFRTTRDIDLLGLDMLKPFPLSIWCALIFTILLASATMTFILRWENRMTRNAVPALEGNSSILTTFAVYCQQAAARPSTLLSGRCLFIILFLSSVIIYNYYTSVLVSNLVGSSTKTNIKTTYDLANSQLDVGFDNVPYIKGHLNGATDPEMVYFIQKKLNRTGKADFTSFLVDTHEGFELVRHGAFAFHCEASTAYPVIEKTFAPMEICDVNRVPFRKDRSQGIVIRKGSPFLKLMSIRLYWMRETGILSKQERHWVAPKPPCLSNAIVTSVGFDYTASLFFFLLISYAIVLIILIVENIIFYWQKRHGRQ